MRAAKVVRVFLWRRLDDENNVVDEVWLENVSDDRMVKILEGAQDAVTDYAKSVNWALGAGPLRYRDTVEYGQLRKGSLSKRRLRRLQSRNDDINRKKARKSYGLLQEI